MSELVAPRRQIYHQGFWDGACFVYAVANAYKALSGARVTRDKWDQVIRRLPDPVRFLTGIGATTLSYEDAVDLVGIMLDAFAEPGERIGNDQLRPGATTAELVERSTRCSSVVHVVDRPRCTGESHRVWRRRSADPAALHIACSLILSSHLHDGRYEEQFHRRLVDTRRRQRPRTARSRLELAVVSTGWTVSCR